MENFFSKVDKTSTNTTYHSPYKFLTSKTSMGKKSARKGDFETTLWMETAGLTAFMSLVVLAPTFLKELLVIM
ncbi:MAG: hypothetical protein AB8B92_06765 [Gammaproteobacteria bacterium]